MKTLKHLLILSALALLSACQREPAPANPAGEPVNVSFQVGMADETKGIGDGSSALRLILRVYDANGNFLRECTESREVQDRGWTLQTALVPGTYTFCFFATSPDADAYTFSGRYLAVDYSKMNINSDEEDAFFGKVGPLAVSTSFNQPVTLNRPLAHICLYSKNGSLGLQAADYGDPDRFVSSLTLTGPAGSGIPTRMNLLDGSVDTPQAAVAFPESPLQVAETDAASGTVLAFAYVLAPVSALTLSQVGFSATLKRTDTVLASGSVNEVPVQQNHRTRLVIPE